MIRRSRGRRGAGIEIAMLLMVVAVAFSALLTSTVIMQIDRKKDAEAQLEQLKQHAVLDQIGRDFCEQQAVPTIPDGYTYAAVVDGLTLTVTENESGAVVLMLTVELTDNGDGTYTVTKWSYGN